MKELIGGLSLGAGVCAIWMAYVSLLGNPITSTDVFFGMILASIVLATVFAVLDIREVRRERDQEESD